MLSVRGFDEENVWNLRNATPSCKYLKIAENY